MATDTNNEQEELLIVKKKTVSDNNQYKSNEYVTVSYDEFVGETLFVSNSLLQVKGKTLGKLDCFFCRMLSEDNDDILFAFKIPKGVYPSDISYTNLYFKAGSTVYKTQMCGTEAFDRKYALFYKIDEEVLKALCDAPSVRMQLRAYEKQPQPLEFANEELKENARMFYNGSFQMGAYTIAKKPTPKQTKRYRMMQPYYRPEWTCGRYDHTHKAAIFYNLIEGMCYFFEDYSAIVLGEVLKAPRNGCVSLAEVAEQTGILAESLEPFFEELVRLNLLTLSIPTAEEIADYRQQVSKFRREQAINTVKTTKEKLPMAVSSAEMDYMEKVGGVTSVMFELTYNCSEKCIHCYNIGATRNDTEASGRGSLCELTLNDYKRIIDQLYEKGVVKVCLSGGDPFSKPFAWDIIEYLYDKGIAFDIFTNGQRIVGDTERLANFYPRLVGVSLYSGLTEVHDHITRIQGSWQKSMAVIKGLTDLAVTVEIKCCVMRPNLKSYYMIADIAQQVGATAQFEVSVTDSIEGDKCVSKYLRLTPEQLEVVLRDNNVPLYVGKEAPNYGGKPRNMAENGCGAGYNTFCITPDGDMIPCCAFHLAFGNLKSQSVEEIFENSDIRKWWVGLTLQQYEDCGRHDYCAYCNLCAGNNHSENGTPTKAGENNCYMAKVRHDLAKKMMQGYDPLQGKSLKERLAEMPDYIPTHIQRVKGDETENVDKCALPKVTL